MPGLPQNDARLKKAVKYAAMSAKIRTAVIEQLTPAVPFLLRFNVKDYGFLTHRCTEKIMDMLMEGGLYEAYVESAIELSEHLQAQGVAGATGKGGSGTGTVTEFTTESFGLYLAETGTTFLWFKTEEKGNILDLVGDLGDMSYSALISAIQTTAAFEITKDVIMDSNDYMNLSQGSQIAVVKSYGSDHAKSAKGKKWLSGLAEKALEMEFAGLGAEVGEEPAAMKGKKTPYMLTTYYGNVWPHTVHQIDLATHEEGPWGGDPGEWQKVFSINGVPMSAGASLSLGLAGLCLNLGAFGNATKKAGASSDNVEPTRIHDIGALGYPSAAKPIAASGDDLLEALITLELTMFIERIKDLKQGSMDKDWDFPYDYASKFFGKIIPKPAPEWQIDSWAALWPQLELAKAGITSNMPKDYYGNLWEQKLRNRARLMYVPVIDHTHQDFPAQSPPISGITEATQFKETMNAAGADAFLIDNFPWDACPKDNKPNDWYDPEDAAKFVNPWFAADGSGIVIQATTEGSDDSGAFPSPSDPFNGGALWFRRQRLEMIKDNANLTASQSSDPFAGQFMLQYFCKRDDEKLFYDVEPDTRENKETEGFMNLLYLFDNRGPNLKGHMNPHYWNKAMKAFFKKIQKKTKGKFPGRKNITTNDLNKFRARGSSYVKMRMGLRLCWWIPSGMPEVPEKTEEGTTLVEFPEDIFGEGDSTISGSGSKSVDIETAFDAKYGDASYTEKKHMLEEEQKKTQFRWYGKEKYGHPDLMAAYEEIQEHGTPDMSSAVATARQKEMKRRLFDEKAHSYIRWHKQGPVYKKYYDITSDGELIGVQKDMTGGEGNNTYIKEQFFCFPICEVLSDDLLTLDVGGGGVDETTGKVTNAELLNWQITDLPASLNEDPWSESSKTYDLILKMIKEPEFRILLEYIFPISSVLPEVATIYGMEFFRVVSEYMEIQRDYFGGVRAVSDSIINAYSQEDNYNFVNEADLMKYMDDS